MTTVRELLAIARKELGYTESPAGSNRTKYGKWMGLDGQAWCMSFVQWCCAQVGVKLPEKTGSCGALMRAAQAAGCWVVRDFQPGDVVIFDFSGRQKTTQHCGIVEMPLPDYGVQAIEGNTSQGGGSQDNGGMVCRKNRAGKYIVGAVRPAFEDEKEDTMTGKEIYDALNKYMSSQKVPSKCEKEFKEAVEMGITDGTNPCQLIPRWQAALMAKRAMEKK